jgi:uncharacterized protein YjbI with pentapeptide repeats
MIRSRALVLPAIVILGLALPGFAGEKDFHDQDLTSKKFNNAALNGADFSDAILKGVQFDKASLKRAIFKGADISGVWFTGADLTEADLREVKGIAVIARSHFDKANLQGMELGCNDCTFRGANLKEAKISGYVYNCDFSGADLRGANLRGMTVHTDTNRWKGALYDDDTAWPEGFDPKAAGAVLSKSPDAASEKKSSDK